LRDSGAEIVFSNLSNREEFLRVIDGRP